jgi:hypothetical protein
MEEHPTINKSRGDSGITNGEPESDTGNIPCIGVLGGTIAATGMIPYTAYTPGLEFGHHQGMGGKAAV